MLGRPALLGADLHRHREPALHRAGAALSRTVSPQKLLPSPVRGVFEFLAAVSSEVARNADLLVRDGVGHQPSTVAPSRGSNPVPGRGQSKEADRIRGMPAPQSIALAPAVASASRTEFDRIKLEIGREDHRRSEGRASDPLLSSDHLHHGRSRVSRRGGSVLQHRAPRQQANHRSEFGGARLVRQ